MVPDIVTAFYNIASYAKIRLQYSFVQSRILCFEGFYIFW